MQSLCWSLVTRDKILVARYHFVRSQHLWFRLIEFSYANLLGENSTNALSVLKGLFFNWLDQRVLDGANNGFIEKFLYCLGLLFLCIGKFKSFRFCLLFSMLHFKLRLGHCHEWSRHSNSNSFRINPVRQVAGLCKNFTFHFNLGVLFNHERLVLVDIVCPWVHWQIWTSPADFELILKEFIQFDLLLNTLDLKWAILTLQERIRHDFARHDWVLFKFAQQINDVFELSVLPWGV